MSHFKTLFISSILVLTAEFATASSLKKCFLDNKNSTAKNSNAEDSEITNCINKNVLPQMGEKAELEYKKYSDRLYQSYDLSPEDIEKYSFYKHYFLSESLQRFEVVDERFDQSAKAFSKYNVQLERNLQAAVDFVAYFHVRSFGRKNSLLFGFNRVEITSNKAKSNEGLLALVDNTLRINLPENAKVDAKLLKKTWDSGDVLLTKSIAKLPRRTLKVMNFFGGNLKSDMGLKVLEYWDMINPISDFRLKLHAVYLLKSKSTVQSVQNLNSVSFVNFMKTHFQSDVSELSDTEIASRQDQLLNVLQSSDHVGQAFDSLFVNDKANSDINIINRSALLCLVKVSNSHVIKVSWDESDFAKSMNQMPAARIDITIKDHEIKVTNAQNKNVHIVNDKTKFGLVCVDTNDNVNVDLNGLLGLIQKKMNQKSLIKMGWNNLQRL